MMDTKMNLHSSPNPFMDKKFIVQTLDNKTNEVLDSKEIVISSQEDLKNEIESINEYNQERDILNQYQKLISQ